MKTMIVEIPQALRVVQGDTLGEKLIAIGRQLYKISDRITFLRIALEKGTCKIDSDGHKSERGWINEYYAMWNDLAEIMLETGIGDVIRGTPLWKAFEDAGSTVHDKLMKLVAEEHARRELEEME